MVLAACAPAATPEPGEPETIVETVVITVEGEGETIVQVVTPTPEPEEMPTTLVVCLGQEPDSFYWTFSQLALSQMLEAVYDGNGTSAFDENTFAYVSPILEKNPSLADGDAVINEVTVAEGDTVVDADANVITLDPAADPPQQIVLAGTTEPVPYEGGEVTMEQMVVTFKLLPDIQWSDGTPLTANDSVYAFNLGADPDTAITKFTIERSASYEATDDLTTVWTGLPGYRDSVYFTNFYRPLPEHIWGQFTAAELEEVVNGDVATYLIGYGPYQLVEYSPGDNVRMVKNENYFRADEGLPYFEEVIYRFVGENSNANIAAILAGECDIVDQTSGLENQSELLLELQASGQLQATFVTGTVWEHADFGIQHVSYDDGYQYPGDRYDFFSDLNVRKAVLHCMDRQAVVDTVMFGQSVVLDTYLPPQHPLFNSEVASYPFDPETGNTLLEEAGWVDSDGDGIREKDGVPFVVRFETTNATQRQQATQVLADSLLGCGIQAQLTYYPSGEWFADWPDGPLFGRNFDLGQFAWLTGVEPPCSLYMSEFTPIDPGDTYISIMTGEEIAPTAGAGGQNNSGFTNAEFDAFCKAALNSLPGQPEYDSNHLEAQRIFAEQLPVAPLYARLKLAATRADMCNFFMDPTNNSEFWNIEEFAYGPLCP
jgi:peptide/nickel transport system substrate-binding protein